MRAELLKLRSMPTPRWTLAILLAFFVGGIVASVIWGVGTDSAVLDLAVGLPGQIAALVVGSWMAGVEFGQNTLRRALSADPRRLRLVLSKLAVLVLAVVAVTVILIVLGTLIFSLAGSGHATSIEIGTAGKILGAWLVADIAWAVTAFSLTLLTRSMAGGLVLSFVFFFVLDGFISLIPKVGDYTIGIALSDLDIAIRGTTDDFFGQTTTNDTGIAVIVLVGWLAVFIAAGIVRTLKTEVK